MARDAIKTIEAALTKGFAAKGAEVHIVAEKSDYKDFIRMYVVSDYFQGMTGKGRLDKIYSLLESFGAASLIERISLCIAMTSKEYDEEFGGDDAFLVNLADAHGGVKRRPNLRRLVRSRK